MGHRFSPLIYIVSEDLVLKYANAVGDSNFIHIDPVRAAAGPFGEIIAPPTFASLFVLKAYRTDSIPPHGGIQLKQPSGLLTETFNWTWELYTISCAHEERRTNEANRCTYCYC